MYCLFFAERRLDAIKPSDLMRPGIAFPQRLGRLSRADVVQPRAFARLVPISALPDLTHPMCAPPRTVADVCPAWRGNAALGARHLHGIRRL